jgi:predicted transcriptional regulator
LSTHDTFRKGNRCSLEITIDILRVASVTVRKTRIMYQANLSFIQVKRYLNDLIEKGLLRHYENSYYQITEKGVEFLRLYDEYIEESIRLEEQTRKSLKERHMLEQMCLGKKSGRGTEVRKNYARKP